MEQYQVRVIKERDDLKKKIDKLEDFISPKDRDYSIIGSLSILEISRLVKQRNIMESYLDILNQRISDFKETRK